MPVPMNDDEAVRLRHGASSRARWLRSLRPAFSPVPGSFGVGARAGWKGGALVPGIILMILLAVFTESALLAGFFWFAFVSLPALFIGGLIGRYLSRFVYVYSMRRLICQGALFGTLAAVFLLTPFVEPQRIAYYRAPDILVLVSCVGAGLLCGAFAARAVARWSGA